MKTLRSLKIMLLLVCLFGFPIVGFWIGGWYYEGRNLQKRVLSESRFAQLEMALHIYHEKHGAFPPTKYQPVADGPIHSWRVLLVPQTSGDLEGYSKYDFSQEWNSSNNLQALGGWPAGIFSTEAGSDIATILAIGDNDDWPSKKPLRSRLITKGKDRFLVVEYPDSKIHWMEPKY